MLLNFYAPLLQSNPIQSRIFITPISNCPIKGDDETEKLRKRSVHDSNWEGQNKAVTNRKQSEIGLSLVEFWKWITGDKSERIWEIQCNTIQPEK